MPTKLELKEAKMSLTSLLSKCDKAILKLEKKSSQHTLMVRRIKALNISLQLIESELQKNISA
ncbi:hypothetical protein C5745_08905 [Sphingobacterium haloxyli]|uniref:Uncharacterized protein n=1 Tax=Sphingobacterium haloxyli TaxID=2100533 RepID=A0A2S9J3T3_9SPHI|nr:hypothetical protein C5745_08905 [Sphingobacterium haloxyli]